MAPDRLELAAVGLAFAARHNRLDRGELAELSALVAAYRDHDHPTAQAVRAFARVAGRRDATPEELDYAGWSLLGDLARQGRKDPPDIDRKDIHG